MTRDFSINLNLNIGFDSRERSLGITWICYATTGYTENQQLAASHVIKSPFRKSMKIVIPSDAADIYKSMTAIKFRHLSAHTPCSVHMNQCSRSSF